MDKLLSLALSRAVKRGNLEVQTANGRTLTFGDGAGTASAIRFTDSNAQIALLRDPDMQLGELFMDGRLTVEKGSIYDFIYLMLQDSRSQRPPMLVRAIDRVRFATRRLRQRNVAAASKRNVAHHYDLDSRLYRLFLDPDMQYSCAYFEQPDQSLEAAQLAKKRHIAAKLMAGPGHDILDIGCGWGGLGLYLSRVAQAKSVKGITLSEEQLAIAQKRAAEQAPSSVAFQLEDYRKTKGAFDRIVSVGMFEHVGVGYYDTYFQSCQRLLKDDGIMLLHTIGCTGVPGFVTPWLDKYIFPGGYIPALSEIVPAIERAGLVMADIEILHTHYARTLRTWRESFMARREQAKALYDERFCRMWEFYLAAAEVAFQCEDLVIFQIVMSKSPHRWPMTRDWIGVRESELRARETA